MQLLIHLATNIADNKIIFMLNVYVWHLARVGIKWLVPSPSYVFTFLFDYVVKRNIDEKILIINPIFSFYLYVFMSDILICHVMLLFSLTNDKTYWCTYGTVWYIRVQTHIFRKVMFLKLMRVYIKYFIFMIIFFL